MWMFHQIIFLFCVVCFLKAQNPSPTANPECNGINSTARHLQHGFRALATRLSQLKSAQCKSNKHCTGVLCSWSEGGALEVDLHHCTHPVTYHVFFKPSNNGANKSITLQKGDVKHLYDSKLITVKIKVTQLERSENIITTSVDLEICPPAPLKGCATQTLLSGQTFCVKMENCPGYNKSIHQYKPCGYKPSDRSSPKQTSPSNSPDHFKTSSSPWQSVSTAPLSDGNVDHHKGDHDHKDDSSGGLSTGAIVGICVAGFVAIFVVVGAIVYWKKYHHRSRLRAAYYNDISMHDPLYEDFGPETA